MDAMVARAVSAGSEGSSSLDNGAAGAASPQQQAQAVKLHFVQQEIEYRIRQAVDAVVGRLEKEAAAAERKVAFMEQELMNVKEHALSMLLNLKHASDAQILHLERQLVNESKRAEEAEARVASLEDTLKRMKADSRKKVQRRAAQEDEDIEEAECRVADSLFLIAGVACDNALSSECQAKQEHASSSSVEAEADESPSPGVRTESDEEESGRKNRKSRTSRQARSSERLSKLASGSKRARGRSSKRSAVDTSSRDSRRLMQGARQLFSLAEKNWR